MRCASRTKNTWLSIGCAPLGFLLLAVRVVQEHQVQIRGIAELHAAELAVADGADAHRRAVRALAAQGRAELRGDLPPAQLHGALDDQLGDVGEAVAHLHERQHAGEIGDRRRETAPRAGTAAGPPPAAPDRPRAAAPGATPDRARSSARSGSCDSRRSSISSSSSSGWAAIWAARKSPWRHSSTSRARAAPFSSSSAK